jgi:uncharacterized membrane protein
MIFFIFIIGVICFFYLNNRMNKLEEMIKSSGKTARPENPVSSANQAVTQVKANAGDVPPLAELIKIPNLNTERTNPQGFQTAPDPVTTASTSANQDSTEFALGSKVFTAVGIVAVLLGVGFFLRYAFENNLISPLTRIIIGVSFGVILSGVAHILKDKYRNYGLALFGAGLGVIYLSFYSAFAFYGLMSATAAFSILSLVTLIGVAFAVTYDSKQLVSFAFLGAFLMPFLLPLTLNAHAFFIFFIIVNLGVLLIARYKVWPELTAGSLLATSLSLTKWVSAPDLVPLLTTQIYIGIIFFIYFITSLINFIRRENDYKGVDSFLLYAIPTFYFLLNLPLVDGRGETALFTFVLAIFYFIASVVIRVVLPEVGETKKFSNALIFISSTFFVLATLIYFQGTSLTLILAVESILMMFMGGLLNTKVTRIAAIMLASFVGFKAAIIDSWGFHDLSTPIFNGRGAVFLMAFLALLSVWIYYRLLAVAKEKEDMDEKNIGSAVGAVGVWLLPLFWMSLEAGDFLSTTEYLSLLWIGYAALFVSISFIFQEKVFRFGSYLLLVVSAISIVIRYTGGNEDFAPIFNLRLISFLAFAIALSYIAALTRKYKDHINEPEKDLKSFMIVGANIAVLWGGSLEVTDIFRTANTTGTSAARVALSVFWLLYGLIALGIGIVARSTSARYFSIILLIITILKIFLYDTQNLSDLYRFVSFIVLGVILLIVGFVYYRFKERITVFVKEEKS